VKRSIGFLYGVVCYAAFLGSFSYAVLFIANLLVPKTVDSGVAGSPLTAVLINSLLFSVFAVQHSVMARRGFKQWWTRIVPQYVERSTFVLAASLALALVLWQWRPIPQVIWDLRGSIVATVLQVLFWGGWAILLLSSFLINHFELFGLHQTWANLRKSEVPRQAFHTPSLYRMVRHPLYLGFIISFWSAPVMTVGHLLFSVACTGYILVGIYFEERDLIHAFGERYLEYKRRVPMLIPLGGRSEKASVQSIRPVEPARVSRRA
jgi:methanethiol S-methyltransferase